MQRVFIGSEAVAAGKVTKYQLRAHFQRVFPDVYARADGPLSVQDRAVVTDLAASALHGARWVDELTPIDLNYPNNKSPQGIITRDETLIDDEVRSLRGLAVTTLPRTAFDLARRGTAGQAVARLDALANAITRSEYIHDLGWRMIRVVAGNRRSEIIERTRRAWPLSQNSAR